MENNTLPPEMMEKIMEYCSVETLKSFRLVSKSCRDWSMKVWQASTVAHVDLFNTNTLAPPGYKPLQFINFVEIGEQLGIPHQFVEFVARGSACGGGYDQLQLFLNSCGSQVKVLTIERFRIPNTYEFQTGLFSACVNLEKIVYSDCTIGSQSEEHLENLDWASCPINRNVKSFSIDNNNMYYYKTCPNIWKELFKTMPCLEDLNIRATKTPTLIEKMFAGICQARVEDSSMLKLKRIRIQNEPMSVPDALPPALLQFLSSSDVHLEKLAIISEGGEGSVQLKEILSSQGGSLNILELGGFAASHFDVTNLCFSPLENLKELRLHGRVFPTLAILSLFPNLEKLVIPEYSKYGRCLVWETLKSPNMFNIHLPKCTDLEFGNFLTAKRMQILIDWIPNVKKLKMPMNNEAFSELCKHWTNLVSIEIPHSKLDGQGITGLDRDDVLRINSGNAEAISSTVPRANITCLKDLKTFAIGSNHGMEVSQLGLCSIQFGFQQLGRLLEVAVCVPVDDEFWERRPAGSRRIESTVYSPKYLTRSLRETSCL